MTTKRGFRQKAQPSKKEQVRVMDTTLRNLQMAVRIMQMSLQQLGNSYQNVTNDLTRTMGLVNNLQYRAQAAQELAGLSVEAINARADELRLVDYNTASAKEDLEKGYTDADVVVANSICTVTTTCENKDKEIFRSKFQLDQCGVPELQQKLVGCKAGDSVEITLNGDKHNLKLLAIKTAPAPAPTQDASADAVVAQAAVDVQAEEASPTAH